jgi:hypothetical protein
MLEKMNEQFKEKGFRGGEEVVNLGEVELVIL